MKSISISKFILIAEVFLLNFIAVPGFVFGLFILFMGLYDADFYFTISGCAILYSLTSGWVTLQWSFDRKALKGERLPIIWFYGCIVGIVLPLLSLLILLLQLEVVRNRYDLILFMSFFSFLFYIPVVHFLIDYRLQILARKATEIADLHPGVAPHNKSINSPH